ncbi:MAG TPA: hypothetical protein VD999_03645 [Vitreimonas sp.]|nr:hypothetical protein [Vitreimonas sp.]
MTSEQPRTYDQLSPVQKDQVSALKQEIATNPWFNTAYIAARLNPELVGFYLKSTHQGEQILPVYQTQDGNQTWFFAVEYHGPQEYRKETTHEGVPRSAVIFHNMK